MAPEICEKHDECLGRIHDSIKNIEVSNAKQEGFMKSIDEFTASIRRDIYSKDGIMERVGNHGNQLILQWGLMSAIVVGIMLALIFKK